MFLLHGLLREKTPQEENGSVTTKTYFGVKLCTKDDAKPCVGLFLTHHADLRGDQVAQSVEPADVGLQVAGFTLPEETLTGKKTKTTLNTFGPQCYGQRH